ncbi:HNH endonuclease [Streptacidiphilus sp. N1-10]|uniref:HNH endonuclease n=1 Tax=Streptacidiphilus jeojiensis TaxID=3229225 RepID=A0ABV6XWL3_9ACTN
MIPLGRPALEERLDRRLVSRTAALVRSGATAEQARRAWSGAAALRRQLREALERMAPGVQRCMYCGDSHGASIDHFEPLARNPLKAFVWVNHLLACTHCNSNHKRDRFPVDASGDCLLVDPTQEDPADHLQLVLRSGEYRPRSEKGAVTIDVFGLNRRALVDGRAAAFVRCRSMLRDIHHQLGSAQGAEADQVADALAIQPFADVLHAMQALREQPGAALVMGEPERESLRWLARRSG